MVSSISRKTPDSTLQVTRGSYEERGYHFSDGYSSSNSFTQNLHGLLDPQRVDQRWRELTQENTKNPMAEPYSQTWNIMDENLYPIGSAIWVFPLKITTTMIYRIHRNICENPQLAHTAGLQKLYIEAYNHRRVRDITLSFENRVWNILTRIQRNTWENLRPGHTAGLQNLCIWVNNYRRVWNIATCFTYNPGNPLITMWDGASDPAYIYVCVNTAGGSTMLDSLRKNPALNIFRKQRNTWENLRLDLKYYMPGSIIIGGSVW